MQSQIAARMAGIGVVQPRLGSRSGICSGTHIMTLDGHLPVELLSSGDRVITRNGTRTLQALHCFWLLDFPVRISRGALGPNRPISDLILGPDQMVRLQDWYEQGTNRSNRFTAPVSRLVDDGLLNWADHSGEMLIFQLEFDDYYTFYAEGLEMISHLPELASATIAAE